MTIDADARAVLDMMKAANRPTFDRMTAPEARIAYRQARRALQPDLPDVAEVRDLVAPAPHGAIPLRLYRGNDAPKTQSPCLVFIHGGGWVVGDLDTHDYVCRKLANETRGTVIAIDYRLGPEHKFPAAVEDCAIAATWIAANAATLGIDAAKLAVGGDSAGGNLSAVLCIISRDIGGPNFVYQALLYPGADMDQPYDGGPGADPQLPLTNALVIWFRDQYLSTLADRRDWRASPAHAANHAGLPPAFVLTAWYDPIGEEGRVYARKLEAAGVPVWHLDMSDQVHGFLTMGKVIRAADAALEMCGAALRLAYAR
jgi:acetyl esterase